MKTSKGQKKLTKYLKLIGERPSVWAKDNKLSPAVISKYLRGITELGPRNAKKIRDASDNWITLDELLD